MALIKCPECGREKVSDTAEMCPDCGYAIKNHFERIHAEEEARRKTAEAALLEERRREEEEKLKAEMYSPVNQKKIIENLEKRKEKALRETWMYAIATVVCFLLLIWSWNNSEHGSLGFIIVTSFFFGIACPFASFSSYQDYTKADSDIYVATLSMEKYYEEVQRRADIAAENLRQSIETQNAKHPVCPNCGSRKTERISTMNRATSIVVTGLASSKIGKQYECKHCKHKW